MQLTALRAAADAEADIQPAYVSPLQFQNYDCDQIAMEMERVSRRVNELYDHLKEKRSKDSTQMTVGLILFWPSLFFYKR